MNPADAALLELGRSLARDGYRHITVSPATHARVLARPGRSRARRLEDVFGWSLPFTRDWMPAATFQLMQAAGVVAPHEDGWRSTIRWSTLGTDLYAHSAYPTAHADAVFFGPDTYRYACALQHHLQHRGTAIGRAVDIGCGAGAGAVMIARHAPMAQVYAVDINAQALRMAAVNAALAPVGNLRCTRSDLLDGLDGSFDLIAANPPFLLDAGERAYRHGGGGLGEGLSLAIAELALARLAPGGTLLLYTGSAIVDGVDAFAEALGRRVAHAGFDSRYDELDPDIFGEELLEPAYAHADRIAAVLFRLTREH